MFHALTTAELNRLSACLELGFWHSLGYTDPPRAATAVGVTVACEIDHIIKDVDVELARRRNCHNALWSRSYEYAANLCHGESSLARRFADAYAKAYAEQTHVPSPAEYNAMNPRGAASRGAGTSIVGPATAYDSVAAAACPAS